MRLYDHIDLRVRDLEKARRFYMKVLPAIGFTKKTQDDKEWLGFTAPGARKREFFGLTVDRKHTPNGTRISFWADTRAQVDRVARVVKKAGGKVLEGPEVCRGYSPNYYAFFFEDPDGNKLEICCRTKPTTR